MVDEPYPLDPWRLDATGWTNEDFNRLRAAGGSEVQQFCRGPDMSPTSWLSRGNKCILMGCRGLGKSFLLAYRSHHHRKAGANTFFHPDGGSDRAIVEKLIKLSGAISERHWLRSADSVDDWSSIWQITIIGLLAWRLCSDRDQLGRYTSVFNTIEPEGKPSGDTSEAGFATPLLQSFLSNLVDNLPANRDACKKSLSELHYVATTTWADAVKKVITRDQTKWRRIAVYLDNPDELCPAHEQDLWLNVQQGLVLAIWKLQKGGSLANELNIYTCVRSEAVLDRVQADLQHALDLALQLRYDSTMLENLFRNQIDLEPPEHLTYPEAKDADPIGAFLGFNSVTHHDRKGRDGSKLMEPVMQALLRHTRLIPREIINFGLHIHKLMVSNRSEPTIRAEINAVASDIVEYVKVNCFPVWPNKLDQWLATIDGEVMTREELGPLANERLDKLNGRSPLEYMLSLGLIGYAEPDMSQHRHFYIQRFAQNSSHRRASAANSNCDYYFIHPALKEWVKDLPERTVPWRSSCNYLIGDGLPYEARPPLFSLMIQNNRPTILFNGVQPLQSGTGHMSDHIRFLFLGLLAWKSRNGMVWPTMTDLQILRGRLDGAYGAIHFANLGTKGVALNKNVRMWAKKINQIDLLKPFSLTPVATDGSHDADLAPSRKSQRSRGHSAVDGRRRGFISVSASDTSGIETTIAFPGVNVMDIFVDLDLDCYRRIIVGIQK